MAGPSSSKDDGHPGPAAPLLHARPPSISSLSSTLGPASTVSNRSPSSSSPSNRQRSRNVAVTWVRTISFVSAVLSAVCAGSVTVFSLYGHIFQERLHYTQFQVNGVAIGLAIALYLPVPLLGYVCDRVGPAPLSLISALLFAGGYGLAAGLYRGAASPPGAPGERGGRGGRDGDEWQYPLMIVAFVAIGVATCSMYLSAVATCAKNFGKGKHRGLALAVPIAAFGLSGMWESQVGSRLLYEELPDGSKGDVDVFKFFIFLAILLFAVGVVGTFGLRIVGEQDLIDEAAEELERSGILDGSGFFRHGRANRGYGTIECPDPFEEEEDAGILEPSRDPEDDEIRKTKDWVLNAETRRFLSDHTMWLFALGFFFMIGPGEAFINNLGTVIGTLYSPTITFSGSTTSAATHVSIVGITSTVARLLTGTLTDILAPTPQATHIQLTSSLTLPAKPFSVSRVTFILSFGIILSLGQVALASGFIQDHGDRFWIVSGLIGAGYGAVFSLTPIIITVIWGVENFATNWGIVAMFPALGSTLWGLVYSAVYQAGAKKRPDSLAGGGVGDEDDLFCHGTQCYAPTFWAMAISVWVACGLVLMAWKGRNGWAQRGILI